MRLGLLRVGLLRVRPTHHLQLSGRHGLRAVVPALLLAPRRPMSSKKPNLTIPEGSAYAVLGVSRQVDTDSLKAIYKSLAVEYHPDRHQGAGKEEAEKKFQEISEAFQVLSDPVKRAMYDEELDSATNAAEAAKAAKRFRAGTWNTEVPDMRARLRNAKREDAGFPPHIIAGTLLFVTGNFVMVVNWLGG